MKWQAALLLFFLACLSLRLDARPPDRKAPEPTGWCLASKGPLEVRAKPGGHKPPLVTLGKGALVLGYETKSANGRAWVRVRAVDPAKLTPQTGWVDSTQVERLPLSEFPRDEELVRQIGSPFLDDFTAANTAVARYLMRQSQGLPAIICFLGGEILPQSRLQVFFRKAGKLALGPYMEFTFSGVQSAITSLEIRNLVGDGCECIVTREPYSAGPQNDGINMVIRRDEKGELATLWKAPLEARNFASYPARVRILQPPEANIGSPGTVTKGDVEFRARGQLTDLVWKGKVELYAVGREQPLESLPIEKVCQWQGDRFSPLK